MKTIDNTILGRMLIPAAMLTAMLPPATSCIHEYPEQGKEVDPTEIVLHIELSTDPSVSTASAIPKSESDNDIFFIIELYQDDYGGVPVFRREISAPKDENGSASVSLTEHVHAGDYHLVAFAAGTDGTDGASCLYDMSDLSNIVYASDSYPGPTDLKECYDLRMDINLPHDEWFAEKHISGLMESPMGRVEIISEDADGLEERIMEMTHAHVADEDFLASYEIQWEYALYFPTGYNALTGVPNKAETGIGFKSDILPLSDNEVLLGYDYVFVNGDYTEVNITLRLYDKVSGEMLNGYSGLEAEIYKGKTTVIRGMFLTTENGSGISIDTGFDGSIDITLPN